MGFDYVKARDWDGAVRALSAPGAVAKMGGCDLLVRHRRGELEAETVVGLDQVEGADELTHSKGLTIGAGVTLDRLASSAAVRQAWPLLAESAGWIASPAIRSAATLVGNVAQGWSVGDLVPVLQVLDAELDVLGPGGRRRLSVRDYAGKPGRDALAQGEVITRLLVPASSSTLRVAYDRFSFRDAFDLPLVSVAVAAGRGDGAKLDDVRIALVGGSAMPARCPDAEAVLEGAMADERSVAAAAEALASWAQPPSDHRASAEYRRHVLSVLLRRALSRLVTH